MNLTYRFTIGETVYYDNEPYTIIEHMGFMFPAYRITNGTINRVEYEYLLKTKPIK